MEKDFNIKEKIQEQLELLLDCDGTNSSVNPIQIRLDWLMKAYQLIELRQPTPSTRS